MASKELGVTEESIRLSRRMAALLADWLVVTFWIMLALSLSLLIQSLLRWTLGGINTYIFFLISMGLLFLLPCFLLTIYLDWKFSASLGQQLMQLTLNYKQESTSRRVLRATLKILPLASFIFAMIHYFHYGLGVLNIICLAFTFLYVLLIILMIVIRKDRRHFVDFLVGSYLLGKA